MDNRTVVIVGGGQAGFQAAASLREQGFSGPVFLISEEGLPYQRPPLSKAYLSRPDPNELLLRGESYYATHDINLVTGTLVTAIDRVARRVVLDSGTAIAYWAVVMATGARPRRPVVPGIDLGGVLTLRTVGDADMIRSTLERASALVVVGGGVLGFEVAAAAREQGLDTTVVERSPAAMTRMLSAETSAYLVAEHRRHGVSVLLGHSVTSLDGGSSGQVREVCLSESPRLRADAVVICAGVLPRTELARASGLNVRDGIVVDSCLRTSDPDIYAIGDCASLPGRGSADRVRSESVHAATSQGRHVASVILGGTAPYRSVPYFWTNQYGTRIQVAGISRGHGSTLRSGDPADGRFSVECLDGDVLLAVESVNSPADHVRARRRLG